MAEPAMPRAYATGTPMTRRPIIASVPRKIVIKFLVQMSSLSTTESIGLKASISTRSVRKKRPIGTQIHDQPMDQRSEEHTSELQSLMRISYAVICLKTKRQLSYK